MAGLPIVGCDGGLARDVNKGFYQSAYVDGKSTGDLTLTGDDRGLAFPYNFILRAFDSTDVDGDETTHRHLKPTDGNLPHRHSLQRSSPPHLWLTPTHESTALSKYSQPLL